METCFTRSVVGFRRGIFEPPRLRWITWINKRPRLHRGLYPTYMECCAVADPVDLIPIKVHPHFLIWHRLIRAQTHPSFTVLYIPEPKRRLS